VRYFTRSDPTHGSGRRADFRNRTSETVIHVASVIYARGFYEKLGYELATNERSGSEPFRMRKTFTAAS
jgi:hypothetical protein